MIFAFVDESGHPTQIRQGPYILCACLIPSEQDVAYLEQLVLDVKKKFNVPPNAEIKGKDIVEGHGPWRKIDRNVRVRFVEELLRELASYKNRQHPKYPTFIVIALKQRWSSQSTRPGEILESGYELLCERILLTSNAWYISNIVPKSTRLHIVIDSTSSAMDAKIKDRIEKIIKYGKYISNYNTPLKERIHVSFRDSKLEVGIQLADLVAYVARHYVMEIREKQGFPMDKYWNIIWNSLLDRKGGRVDGVGWKLVQV